MSVDYSQIQKITYGSASLSLTTYRVYSRALIEEGIARVGTAVLFEGSGELVADSQSALTTALTNCIQQLSISGQDLIVYGLANTQEYTLLAAQCLNGGPHAEFTVDDGPVACSKTISFRFRTEISLASSPYNNYQSEAALRPDGLRTITWSGEVNGPNAPAYFLGTVLPQFEAAYTRPDWKIDIDYAQGNETNVPIVGQAGLQSQQIVKVRYKLMATEFYGALPVGTGSTAVDGTIQQSSETDEQGRQTITFSLDLLVVGDPFSVLASLQAAFFAGAPDNQPWYRLSVQLETLKENRLRATLVRLQAGDQSRVLSWTESFRVSTPGDEWEELTFIGADPIMVKKPKRIGRISQGGSATGDRRFIKPPSAAFGSFPIELDSVSLSDRNAVEKATDWEMQGFLAGSDGVPIDTSDLSSLDVTQLARVNQQIQYLGGGNGG